MQTDHALPRLSGVLVAAVSAIFAAINGGQLHMWAPSAVVGLVAAFVPIKIIKLIAYGLVTVSFLPVSLYFLVGIVAGQGDLSTAPFLQIGLLTVGAAAGVTGWISTFGLRHGESDSDSR